MCHSLSSYNKSVQYLLDIEKKSTFSFYTTSSCTDTFISFKTNKLENLDIFHTW